jgi:anti-sigma regulatory factor (Ser/Thr protein kinase)
MEQASGVDERRAEPLRRGAAIARGARAGFSHEALLYSGDGEFASAVASFVSRSLAADEPILIAVRDERRAIVREALGDDAARVILQGVSELGRNPARLIPAWLRFLEEFGTDGRSVAVFGECIWPGRTRAELSECCRYEELVNVAFAGTRAWRLVCPYDVDALDDDVLELARATHPLLRRDGKAEANDAYQDADAMRPLEGRLPDPPAQAQAVTFTVTSLHELRELVSEIAHRAQLSSERTENLRLAVNELASNSVRHGGGAGTLTTWRQDGVLVFQVSDGGRIGERLVGRVRPEPEQASGRGLWLVNHLCDLVQIRSDAHGSSVRVQMRLDDDAATVDA